MVKAMERQGKSVSLLAKKARARLKKEEPIPKQSPPQERNKIQRTKTQ